MPDDHQNMKMSLFIRSESYRLIWTCVGVNFYLLHHVFFSLGSMTHS